jgi:hypothetical protein
MRPLMVWTLAAWSACAACGRVEAAPTAKAGPYTVTVEQVARVLDLGRTQPPRGSLVVTVSVQAEEPAHLDRLMQVAGEAAARDELLGVLEFCELRPVLCAEVTHRRAEIVFSAASPMAHSLRSLTASLVSSKGSETVRLQAPATAGGTATDAPRGLSVTVDSVQAGKDARGEPAHVTQFTVSVASDAPDLTWLEERIVLSDDQGMAHAALSATRTYEYDDEGQRLAAVKVTAYFAPLAEGRRPKTLRYSLQRAVGVEALPYQFRNLPLP